MEVQIPNADTDRVAWLKWRRDGIGSSDAPAVHDKSPYMTRVELVEDKIDEGIPEEDDSNAFVKEKGNRLEAVARKLFAAEFNLERMSEVDEDFAARHIVNDDLPIIRASCDGATRDLSEGWENKYMGLEAHQRVSDESLPIRGGRVPEYYWIQMQHQMLAANGVMKCVHFTSINEKDPEGKKLRRVVVLPDEQFLIEHIEACTSLWKNHVMTKTLPDPGQRDFKLLRTAGAKKLAKRLLYLKEKEKEIEAEKKEVEKALGDMYKAENHPKMRVAGMRIMTQSRSGSVEYKNIPEVMALKPEYIESFRKAGTSFIVFKPEIEEMEAESKPKTPKGKKGKTDAGSNEQQQSFPV